MNKLIYKLMNNQEIRQFISYVLVGGAATLVEWGCFYVLNTTLAVNHLFATAIAFTISTAANWLFGRLLTFRNAPKTNRGAEIAKIYAVAVVGLLANLGLMYLLVDLCLLPGMVSKILATAIVFAWNFLSRKLWIYREPPR